MKPEEITGAPQTEIERKTEAQRVVRRLTGLVEEHVQAALPLGIELCREDLLAVIEALRDHAQGGAGLPVSGARDAIHGHVLNRLFEELVEEPSNILYAKDNATGKEPSGYEAMSVGFWLECLDCMEAELGSF